MEVADDPSDLMLDTIGEVCGLVAQTIRDFQEEA
jgi:hypothetical protein